MLGSPLYYYDEPYQEYLSGGHLRGFQRTDRYHMDVRKHLNNEEFNRGGLGNHKYGNSIVETVSFVTDKNVTMTFDLRYKLTIFIPYL